MSHLLSAVIFVSADSYLKSIHISLLLITILFPIDLRNVQSVENETFLPLLGKIKADLEFDGTNEISKTEATKDSWRNVLKLAAWQ